MGSGGIRATLSVSRKVNRLKAEYPKLYNAFEEARKRADYGVNHWLFVSEEAHAEYVALVEKYLAVTKVPNSNRKVVITTHNGGKFAGFYDSGKWWYNTVDERHIEVTSHVIKWEKYHY